MTKPICLFRPKKTDPRSPDRQICLVPELCHLTGLPDRARNDHRLTRDLAEATAASPRQRRDALAAFVGAVAASPAAAAVLAEWGLRLSDSAVVTRGKVLDDVKLVVGGSNRFVEPAITFCLLKSCWSFTQKGSKIPTVLTHFLLLRSYFFFLNHIPLLRS